MSDSPRTGMTYQDAGVDIGAGNELVRRIGPLAAATATAGVLSGLGGFGGLFQLDTTQMTDPVLVSGTDGVGTKLKIAFDTGVHNTVGIDLVAMCVNDIIVTGAQPLFFLDYFGCGQLDVDAAADVVSGIAEGCKRAGCALIGGETAEMPGFYTDGEYDLAGFSVGVVDRPKLIDGSKVAAGDVVLGISSAGLHSNGYSLARKILFEAAGLTVNDPFPGLDQTVGQVLLTPTRIYVLPLLALLAQVPVHAMAHITGGGLTENLPRVLPDGLQVRINSGAWQVPALFTQLQQMGGVEIAEMRRTFNMGVGMCVVVSARNQAMAQDLLTQSLSAEGGQVTVIGRIEEGADGVVYD